MPELPFANKSLGQHWLSDPAALKAICDAGEITTTDIILEIGPGTGTLTEFLVQQAKQVIAVEKDSFLVKKLCERLNLSHKDVNNTLQGQPKNYVRGSTSHMGDAYGLDAKLLVVEGDILSFDLTSLPLDYKVIANIPYYLTSNLIRILSETPNRAAMVVLLVQKEVAQRIAAKPGAMSLLSVSAQFYWEVSLGMEIPARLFTPPPKVDSQVILLKRRSEPLFPGIDSKQFFRIVKAGYSARRKTLLNSLSAGLRMDKDVTIKVLDRAGLSPQQRAQTLSLADWHKLYICLI